MDRADDRRCNGSACADRRAALRDVSDGVATFETADALEQHAETCARCAAALAEARALRAALDTLTEPIATGADDDAFVAAVLGRLDSRAPAPVRRSRLRPVVTLAAAACAAAAVGLWIVDAGRRNTVNDADEAIRVALGSPVVPPTVDTVELADPGPAVAPTTVSAATASAATASAATVPAATASAATVPAATVPAVESEPAAAPLRPRGLEVDLELRPVAPEAFAAAVRTSAAELDFDPFVASDARAFVSAVEGTLGTDARGAARAALGDADATNPNVAALAARVLGSRADFRDRVLIEDTLAVTGSAGLRAVVDRGARGVERLWHLADADDAEIGSAARDLLVELEANDAALARAPRGVDPGLVAEIAARATSSSAESLLERYLTTGAPAWREAWFAHDGADVALADALVSLRPRRSDARAARLLDALATRPIDGGLGPALAALRHGELRAADAVAAYAANGGAEALLGATLAGRLPTDTEDAAWRATVASDPRAVLAAARGAGALDVAVEAVSRAFDGPLPAPAIELLVGLAEVAEGRTALRTGVLALLAVAERGGVSTTDHHARLAALGDHADTPLAAAAWLARVRLTDSTESLPAPFIAVLARGGSPHVVHLRLVRALERLRAGSN